MQLLAACGDSAGKDRGHSTPGKEKGAAITDQSPEALNYTVIKVYPHDTTSFTEGLLVENGILYESTGYTEEIPYSRSLFGAVDLATGKIQVKAELDKEKYFGEGITFLGGKVYQLTYRTKVGFIYDAGTFKKLGEFPIPGKEGWGMTTDGASLIMSDGTPVIYYIDPKDFSVTRTITVTINNTPEDSINELEYIHGYIYANRYTRNYILKIDPVNGRVVGRLDLSSLAEGIQYKHPGALEMNGIAYDPVSDKIYITGKLWPELYEIQFPHLPKVP